jgi:hypothetical protein
VTPFWYSLSTSAFGLRGEASGSTKTRRKARAGRATQSLPRAQLPWQYKYIRLIPWNRALGKLIVV